MTMQLYRYPYTIEDLIAQLLAALDEAIADAQQHKARFTACNGQLVISMGGSFTYTFTLREDEAWEPASHLEVQIEIDPDDPEAVIIGTILSTANLTMTLVTDVPLPSVTLKKITLFEADTWLLKKLRDAIEQVQDAPWHMAAKTFGLMPSHEDRGRRQAVIATFKPDPDQIHAIEVGMASERLVLIGPPGTGKTSTYAGLALEYLLAGKTVLLVAQTNMAIDHAVERLLGYCKQSRNEHFIKEHRIVRLGTPKHLTEKAYQQVALQALVDEQLGVLARERDRLQHEQHDLEETLKHLRQELVQEH